jgi:hypothetical protein
VPINSSMALAALPGGATWMPMRMLSEPRR